MKNTRLTDRQRDKWTNRQTFIPSYAGKTQLLCLSFCSHFYGLRTAMWLSDLIVVLILFHFGLPLRAVAWPLPAESTPLKILFLFECVHVYVCVCVCACWLHNQRLFCSCCCLQCKMLNCLARVKNKNLQWKDEWKMKISWFSTKFQLRNIADLAKVVIFLVSRKCLEGTF